MTEQSISYVVRELIAEVTINRPPVNALSSSEWKDLTEVFYSIGSRNDVSVVILTAAGRGFCAGADIQETAADTNGRIIVQVNKACRECFAAIYDCPVPVIGAIHGFCVGGGIGLAGSCDMLIAAENATFGLPEIDRGALGAATHLIRLFPPLKARRMFYTGSTVDAHEAYRLGAVEKVVAPDELLEEARNLAREITDKSIEALRLAKESLNGIELIDVKKSYRFEQGFTLELFTSEDSAEARRAFVEKRPPSFKKKRQ